MNGGKGRGEADASASVNKFVKSPIIYKTIPPRKNAGYGPVPLFHILLSWSGSHWSHTHTHTHTSSSLLETLMNRIQLHQAKKKTYGSVNIFKRLLPGYDL